MKHVAIFASGNGSNAENLIKYFSNHKEIQVQLVCTNKATAKVLARASNHNVTTFVFDKESLLNGSVLKHLRNASIDFIILAGFLWLIPKNLTEVFHNRILNIHPALLPKYGGAGMYGQSVHEAVIAAGEKESGITIHLVNENYDEGKIIFQKSFTIYDPETVESLESKIHELEYQYFPQVVESYIQNFQPEVE